jgi:DMSO/TMAO reductase YedYZ molybdopterin-dependent catalytic subunit
MATRRKAREPDIRTVFDRLSDDVLLVWAMNGAPLLPQHGFPLRLIVPGWYGMASVKWLTRIEALTQPFDGYQQVAGYLPLEPDGPRT